MNHRIVSGIRTPMATGGALGNAIGRWISRIENRLADEIGDDADDFDDQVKLALRKIGDRPRLKKRGLSPIFPYFPSMVPFYSDNSASLCRIVLTFPQSVAE